MALALDVCGITLEHRPQTLGRVPIEVGNQLLVQQGQYVLDQCSAPRHPLVVGAATVVVWAVQARAGESVHQPAEERLVAHVHPKRYLWLLAIAPERALPDEQPHEDPTIEFGQIRHFAICTGAVVSPGVKT
jgi:hypothetical protein